MKSKEIVPEIYVLPDPPWTDNEEFQSPAEILVILLESDSWDEEREYLVKVFSAAKKEMDKDMHVLRLPASARVTFSDLKQQTSFKDLYLFGVEAGQIGLQSTLPYGILVQLGETMIYRTDTPLKVRNNKEMRNRLWQLFKNRYLHVDNG